MRPFIVHTGSPDLARETLRMVARLHAAPSAAELSGAAVLERWRLFPGEPYMLQGHVGSSLKSGVAFALDIDAGWARLIDRWVRLGVPAAAPPRVANEAVMQAAARALERDDSRPPPQPSPFQGEGAHRLWGEGANRLCGEGTHQLCDEIGAQARVLAGRAREAGLDAAAYLLDMAVLELDARSPAARIECAKFGTSAKRSAKLADY